MWCLTLHLPPGGRRAFALHCMCSSGAVSLPRHRCSQLWHASWSTMPHLQETELLVAGIPCIDVSSAGHRRGAAGLVRQFYRLTLACRSAVPHRCCRSVPLGLPCPSLQNCSFDPLVPCLLTLQSTGCGRHVFRLLRQAQRDRRPIPWLLLENARLSLAFPILPLFIHTSAFHCPALPYSGRTLVGDITPQN